MIISNDHKLESLIIHLTNACANKCPYCYAYTEDKVKHAETENIYKLLNIISEANISNVSFLGGDPVLHPDIFNFIKYAKNLDLKVSLMSNTMEISNVKFEELVKYVSTFEATILGQSEFEHDNFCKNRGAYKKLVNNLKKLTMLNAKIGIAINIIPNNADSIYNMIKNLVEIEKIHINYIIIQRIVPFGRAYASNEYNLTKDSANIALDCIDKIHKNFGIKITVEDPFPLCVIEKKYWKYMNPCEWGYKKAALNGNGDFSRCGADPRYLLGNIFNTPILDIWENSPILISFRKGNYLSKKCTTCKNVNLCRGGCPLSCELNMDHGMDYLFEKYQEKNNA